MSFQFLVNKALANQPLTRDEAHQVLQTPDDQMQELLQAAYAVRRTTFGNKVKLCVLMNARSGLCPEDCHYCSQSSVSKANIDLYGLLAKKELLDGARRAFEAKARRYCMVGSGRGPSDEDIDHIVETVTEIKQRYPLEICICLGLMTEAQARRLKEVGVGWVNHNLNTSRRFYPEICTTHTYDDRVQTVKNVKEAGLKTCSGGIVGMGETDDDIVEMAYAVRELRIDSIPVNFLHPIPGTPLESARYLTPQKCLKVLCLFRFLNPTSEIRAAGGREVNLGPYQAQALYAANSIFVEGYLTTPGQDAAAAHRMIEELGFEVEPVSA
ncbi:MAG: biotin synthase BioB [Candidatus Omnitrophica bacterium]|nr:biotin synthase BioB [Candidatus Omnitrophota bacterium]